MPVIEDVSLQNVYTEVDRDKYSWLDIISLK